MSRTALILVIFPLFMNGCRDRAVDTGDQSTPQATVRSLVYSMDRIDRPEPFDARELNRFFTSETESQQAYVEAWIELLAATRLLQEQARARFGREEARQMLGPARPGEDHIRRFTETGVRQISENNRATLVTRDGQVMTFRKDGSEWKIVPDHSADGENEADLTEATRIMSGLAKILAEVAEGIDTRQVESADDARQVLTQEAHRIALGI